ncbi:hypothetical protein, partial [Halorubrum ezzemoulense]|uniref:hypothetical protein n=1 Tax=Halorubrum ezzemoulense TaxID=337243 RepID=UPI001B7FEB85
QRKTPLPPRRSQRKTPSFPTTITTQDAVVPHVDITLSTTPLVATPVLARLNDRTHHTETPP